MRGFHDVLREVILSVHVVGMVLNLSRFPDDLVHASGFFGQITGVLQLHMMAQVYGVFCHSRHLGVVEACQWY
jgi:hypothetical protein